MKPIFNNFLKDKDIYFACVEYWEKLFKNSLHNIEFENYFNTKYANGEDFLDGNPIFNFRIKNSNRAVFIVQEESNSDDVYFKSWIDEFETEDETILKLVIVLELNEKSEYLTIDLVKKWIIIKENPTEIESEIKFLTSYIPAKLGNNIFSEIFNLESPEIINLSSISKNSKLHELLEI